MLDSSSHQLGIGTTLLDRFTILERVGRGGNGVVYRARDSELSGQEVAIKCVAIDSSAAPTVVDRLAREVVLTRRLQHNHIVTVYEFLHLDANSPLIVMEFVDGGTLASLIGSGALAMLPVADRLELLRQIASALAYAHAAGIVHRDIKPENILLSREGDAKLTDFGLARCFDDDQRLTATGTSLGTPYYMSPEQFRGEDAGPAADIYSFGILAYELLTGEKPFNDTVYFALALKHVLAPLPAPPVWGEEMPEWLLPLIHRCTAKEVDKRFRTMEEVALLLAQNETAHVGGKRQEAVDRLRAHELRAKVMTKLAALSRAVFKAVICVVLLQVVLIGTGQFSPNMKQRVAALALQAEAILGSPLLVPLKFAMGVSDLRLDRPERLFEELARVSATDFQLNTLVRAGADVNVRDGSGNTPLHRAALSKPSKFLFMVQRGGDINLRGADGASAFQLLLSTSNVARDVVDRLLPRADFGSKDSLGRNLLHYAIANGTVHAIRSIVADPRGTLVINGTDLRGLTPLMLAIQNDVPNLEEVVRALLAGGADPAATEAEGQTALHLAIRGRNSGAAALIAERSDPETLRITDADGQTPLSRLKSLANPSAEELALGELLERRGS